MSRRLATLLSLLLLGACSSDSESNSEASPGAGDGPEPLALGLGAPPSGPAWNLGGRPLFAEPDPNRGGSLSELRIAEMHFGQLVDVYVSRPGESERHLVVRDFFVGQAVGDRPGAWTLDEHPVSGKTRITIPHSADSAAFKEAIQALDRTPTPAPVSDGSVGPFPVFLRDAALSLRFDDLLDPDSLYADGVALTVGEGFQAPFDARVLADAYHGGFVDRDGDGRVEYYPTRIVIGATKSAIDVRRDTVAGAVNTLGLPPAQSADVPNVVLRLPTQTAPVIGVFTPLRNLSGSTLAATGQGPVDDMSPSVDLLRYFRSGSPDLDPDGGRLADDDAPRLLGTSIVELGGLRPYTAGLAKEYLVDLRFTDPRYFHALRAGEILSQPRVDFEVVKDTARPDESGIVRGVVLTPLAGDPRELTPGLTALSDPYDAGIDEKRSGNFLAVSPASPQFEASILPESTFQTRFNEPLDPTTLDGFETFRVTRQRTPAAPSDYVVGEALAFASLDLLSFIPSLPLRAEQGVPTDYWVHVSSELTDLSGNGLGLEFIQQVKVDLDAPTRATNGFALRFETPDEDGDGLPEVRGQHRALGSGLLEPRPLQRFSVAADDAVPTRQLMTAFNQGIPTPLTPLGARLQTTWRYNDLGLGLFDEAYHNVDVEGLYLSPFGGQVIADAFAEFQIALGHASRFPDEGLAPTLFPQYPNSGLSTTFADNSTGALEVVHPRGLGYMLSPADLTTSAAGTPLLPLPLNRGVRASEFRTFTWRDTALQVQGGRGGGGLEPAIAQTLDPTVVPGTEYAAGAIPSIGLPLLMDLRCYPYQFATGLNGFDIKLAVNSAANPNFRAYSSGGVNASGIIVLVDPDLQPQATGGFQPGTGMPTLPADPVSYTGQVDLVTRVSRVHSRWFDTGTSSPTFASPVLVGDLPPGTSIELAYRGATNVLPVAADANEIDFYGDAPLGTVTYGPLNDTWTEDLTDLDGQRFVQVRISFVGDLETQATSALSGLGFAWTE